MRYAHQCSIINTMDKKEIRAKYKIIRNSLNYTIRNMKSDFIFKKIICNQKFLSAKNIMIYNSFSSEVITDNIINHAIKNGKSVFLPKCVPHTNIMHAVRYFANDSFDKNEYGISEPKNHLIYNGIIDLIIVPGIAFDKYGARIGFGKGYYDKYIGSLNVFPYLIALAFDEQISNEKIPTEEQDIFMNEIITDKHDYIINANDDFAK